MHIDTSHNSDAVGELTADRWLKANERLTQRYTNLHIWIEITLAALKQGNLHNEHKELHRLYSMTPT